MSRKIAALYKKYKVPIHNFYGTDHVLSMSTALSVDKFTVNNNGSTQSTDNEDMVQKTLSYGMCVH